MTNTYDALSRLSSQTRPMSQITYSYLAGANGTTTGLVSSVTHSKVGSNSFSPITFSYAYDELGYITSYTQTGKQAVTYDYDIQGQLTSVTDVNQDLYYTYEYDTYGNIRSATAEGIVRTDYVEEKEYGYANTKWLDLLTGFNDEPIWYEGQTLVDGFITGDPTSGNPISYFNGTRWTFDWESGRQLASASTTDGDTTIDIDYTYDINGLRTSKTITRTTITNDDEDEGGEVQDCTHNWVEIGRTQYIITYQCSICNATYEEPIQQQEEFSLRSATVTMEKHDYVYASGRLLRETITITDAEGNVTTEVLDFTYDASGSPYTLTYNGTTYYYVVNLQGDVIRLVSANGATVAEYTYDPYGKVVSTTGAMAEINPLRYRGYYHDTNTGFYYLQSRYYDPSICRFINADRYASTGQGFVGFNMFVYCLNNPTNYVDDFGDNAETLSWWSCTMWWLCAADTALPIGDIIYGAGILVLGVYALISADEATSTTVYLEEENEELEPPDVTYPGDDPKVAPEGTEWKGNGEQGSKQGNYYNPETGESWHPDLDHPAPIGPHWDYRDPTGTWWRVGPGNVITPK